MSRHKEMTEKAKVMMERLKANNVAMDNGKPDSNVIAFLLHLINFVFDIHIYG